MKLPSDWKHVKISDIANVKSSKRIFANDYVEKGILFYRSKEIVELSRKREIKKDLYISKERYSEIKQRFGVPKKGDILLTSVGTIGNAWIVDDREFYYKDGNLTLIECSNLINNNYLNLFIQSPSFYQQISECISGTAYNALTIEKIKELVIALPPLEIQRTIVKKLQSVFGKLEQAEKELEEAKKTQLKIEQSLFNSLFSNKEYPQIKIVNETVINPPKSEVNDLGDIEVSFIPMAYVDDIMGKIIKQDKRKISEVRKGYTYFRNNDVLFAKITPCMENGKCAVASNLYNGVGFGTTEFIVLRPSKNLLSEYLHCILRSDKFRNDAKSNMTGTAGQARVPKSYIEDYLIPFPSLDEQQKIIKRFNNTLNALNVVNNYIQDTKKDMKKLRQSLLQKAFSGELVN